MKYPKRKIQNYFEFPFNSRIYKLIFNIFHLEKLKNSNWKNKPSRITQVFQIILPGSWSNT